MCVLAGAGTGKTRAITHRIAYGVHAGAYQPQRVLAVTFTARAAGEMRTRLRDLGVAGVQARTFHAAALRQLHYFWPQAVGGAAPEVMSHKAPAVAQAAASLRLQFDRTGIRDLAAEVEWAKVNMLTPETYAAAATASRREPPGIDATGMARLLEVYEQVKSDRGVIDFEDVLLVTVGILAERDDIARTVRQQYRHFVVDEYQDVNTLQQRLLDLWLGERDDICVVGDPAQTIYSFTGASPRHLLGFTQRHQKARVVRLVRNYRSTPQIVSLANLVVRGPSGQARSHSVQLEAQGAAGPEPVLTAHPDDPPRPRPSRATSPRGSRRRSPADMASSSAPTGSRGVRVGPGRARHPLPRPGRRALLRPQGGARRDPAHARGRPLGRRQRAAARPRPRHPRRGGWTRESPPAAGPRGSAGSRWPRWPPSPTRLVATTPEARLPQFVRELDERAAAQHAPTVQGVTLASLHAAKGLEWTPSSSPGAPTASFPSRWPTPPRPSRRSAA